MSDENLFLHKGMWAPGHWQLPGSLNIPLARLLPTYAATAITHRPSVPVNGFRFSGMPHNAESCMFKLIGSFMDKLRQLLMFCSPVVLWCLMLLLFKLQGLLLVRLPWYCRNQFYVARFFLHHLRQVLDLVLH